MARAVPDGASFFASLCSSTISARGRYAAASAARRIISTAPIAKFGAKKTAKPRSRPRASTGARSAPLVPTTHGTPASSARSNVADDHVRRREVDRRVGGLELGELVPGRLERGREHAPDLPAPSVQADLHAAATARTRPGLIPLTAAVNVRSSGPMPDGRERVRAEAAPRRAPRSRPARPRRSPRSGGRARAARCP